MHPHLIRQTHHSHVFESVKHALFPDSRSRCHGGPLPSKHCILRPLCLWVPSFGPNDGVLFASPSSAPNTNTLFVSISTRGEAMSGITTSSAHRIVSCLMLPLSGRRGWPAAPPHRMRSRKWRPSCTGNLWEHSHGLPSGLTQISHSPPQISHSPPNRVSSRVQPVIGHHGLNPTHVL